MPGKRAWDCMADEPNKAYALFLLYRSLGIGRTVKEVASRISQPVNKVQVVANRYNWVFRADQWDAWALRYKSKAQEHRLMREAQIEARTVTDVLKMARILARRALKSVVRDKAFTPTPGQAASLADLAVKLARLERGEVTSRSGTEMKQVRETLKERLEQIASDISARQEKGKS